MHLLKKNMSIYQASIDKAVLQEYAMEVFPGAIHVFQGADIPDAVSNYLLNQRVIGFDTETKPNFSKGGSNKISLIQLACESDCFLFRLKYPEPFPSVLRKIFNSPRIMKVGLSSRDDFHGLRAIVKGFAPRNVVELQNFVKSFGIEDMSLQKIYAIVFSKRISKSQQLSNWEAPELTEAQKMYAALDAWAVRRIYLRLQEGI